MADLIAGAYEVALARHARGRLLDLGCGKAPLYGTYSKLVSETTCVDWGGTVHPSEHVDLEWDLNRDLPFNDSRFETVILSDVLEHLPEPSALWREMARVLSPGGKVLLSVPFLYSLHEQPHDYYRYTEFALRRFAGRSGLRILEMRALGGAPEVLADIIAKNVASLPTVGRRLALATQWVAGISARTRMGSRISRRTSARFPLAYFLVAERPTT